MLVLNAPAFILGIGSLAASFGVGHALGWMDFGESPPSPPDPREHYVVMLAAGLLGAGDLTWRACAARRLDTPPPGTLITRAGRATPPPRPRAEGLAVLLSGDNGAQFFWVIPGWLLAVLLLVAGLAL